MLFGLSNCVPKMKQTTNEDRTGMRTVLKRFAIVLLAPILILTGCASSEGTTQPIVAEEFSATDIMFAQMMIPHHEQALEMGKLALESAESSEVRELATQISLEQGPEITQMMGWLLAADAPKDMGHGSHSMAGMLTDEQLAELGAASGADFDRLFLEGMILHHEGAISMARTVQESTNAEVRALSESIIASQQSQIDLMKSLLQR